MIKNKAEQKVRFDAGQSGIGGDISTFVSKDGGAFAATTNAAAAVASVASGKIYEVELTAAETNADTVEFYWVYFTQEEVLRFAMTPDTGQQVKAIKSLLNKAAYDKETGVVTVYDDDGTTALFTQTMTVASNVEMRTRTDA
jgi:hypothetical protein